VVNCGIGPGFLILIVIIGDSFERGVPNPPRSIHFTYRVQYSLSTAFNSVPTTSIEVGVDACTCRTVCVVRRMLFSRGGCYFPITSVPNSQRPICSKLNTQNKIWIHMHACASFLSPTPPMSVCSSFTVVHIPASYSGERTQLLPLRTSRFVFRRIPTQV